MSELRRFRHPGIERFVDLLEPVRLGQWVRARPAGTLGT